MQGSFANLFALHLPTVQPIIWENLQQISCSASLPPCILSSPRVLNFAVEEDIAHSESLPAITSSHILAQSEVSRMRRYRSVLQHLNT